MLVWYACYGSNIAKERILKYIAQCEDKTLPIKNIAFKIPHQLYFAKKSTTWDGAVAFIDHVKNETNSSLGRVWLITEDQFNKIKELEGRKYTKEINLGRLEGYSVKTFTNEKPMKQNIDGNKPSEAYLKIIKKGLKETYPEMSEKNINIYLSKSVDA